MDTRLGKRALLVLLLFGLYPAARATPIVDLQVIPDTLVVPQGRDYVVHVRLMNLSDAGETLGAVPLGPIFTSFGSVVGGVVAGQTLTPLFNSSILDPLLNPGESIDFDFVRLSTDLGSLGLLAPGTYQQSITMTFAFFFDPVVVPGAGSASADFTVNVVPAPEPGTWLLAGSAMLMLAATDRRRRCERRLRDDPKACAGTARGYTRESS